jgi:hypothetical protein
MSEYLSVPLAKRHDQLDFEDAGPWHRCTSFTVTDSRSSYENVAAAEEEDWKARGRLRAALRGFREVDAQMLELVLWGPRS